METTLWTIGFQAVNVLVLVWLLARFLFRPIAAMVAQRREEATRLVEEARADREAAAAARRAQDEEAERLAQTRAERLRALGEEVEAQRTALLAAAGEEADRMREEAQAGIEKARQEAGQAAERGAHLLAVDIAAKLLGRLPAETRVLPFVGGLGAAVAGLAEVARQELGRDGAAVPLVAPRPLTAAEEAACVAALGEALGRPVRLAVRTDPALIAGLEIEAPHAVIRNSLRADLDRVAAGLENAHG